jgi:hypothetical protein
MVNTDVVAPIVYSLLFLTVFMVETGVVSPSLIGISQSLDRCRSIDLAKSKEMKSRRRRIVFVALGLINHVEFIAKTYVSI